MGELLSEAKKYLDEINNYNPKEVNITKLFNLFVEIVEKQNDNILILNHKTNSLYKTISTGLPPED